MAALSTDNYDLGWIGLDTFSSFHNACIPLMNMTQKGDIELCYLRRIISKLRKV